MKRPDDERSSLGMRIECGLIGALMLLPVASCAVHTIGDFLPKQSAAILDIIHRLLPSSKIKPDGGLSPIDADKGIADR